MTGIRAATGVDVLEKKINWDSIPSHLNLYETFSLRLSFASHDQVPPYMNDSYSKIVQDKETLWYLCGRDLKSLLILEDGCTAQRCMVASLNVKFISCSIGSTTEPVGRILRVSVPRMAQLSR
jgi:hypothetical protein